MNRKIGVVAAVLAIWAAVIGVQAAEPHDASLPLAQVAPTDEKIVVDGRMDEAVWRDAPVLGPFVNLRGDGYPMAQTEARIVRTAKELVIFLRCYEPHMDKLSAVAGIGDWKLFDDDHVELFVQKAEQESGFYQFVANSRGVRMQLANDNNKWDAAWQAASGTFEDGWTLEIALPFATLGLDPERRETLRLNICRQRPHAMELSAWSSPRGLQFREMSRFGTLRFVARLPLQWSVRPPPVGDAAPVVELTGRPFAANDVANPLLDQPEYTATLQTFSDTVPVATTEKKAKFELGLYRFIKLPFTPPPGRKASVSVTLRDPTGGVVLATTDFPIAVADPRWEWLRQIHAALEELPSGRAPAQSWFGRIFRKPAGDSRRRRAPAQFAERLKAWRQEAADCNEQTDGERLRSLAQALRSVRLAATLPDGDTAAATTFVLPTFTRTAYDLIPERVGQPLACSVFRGETKSLTLNIFAFRDLSNVTVAVNNLTAGGAKLAATNLDTRLVMNWWQSSSDAFVSDTPVLVPELLVKDDSIVALDMVKRRDVFNFDLRIGPEDPPELRPFSIPAFHNRQVWLTLRTPAAQPAGVYTGRVVVNAAGKAVASAACAVTVLPVTLEPTHGQFSAYNYFKVDDSLRETDPRPDTRRVPRDWYERMLACVREYGFNALSVLEGGTAKWNGKTWEADLSLVREALRLRRQCGLMGATDYSGFNWDFGALCTVHDIPIAELESPAPGTPADGFLAVCRQIKDLADELGFHAIYIYAEDEPTDKHIMPREIAVCRLIQRSGLPAASAITLKGALEARDVLARPIITPEAVVGEREPIGGLTNAVQYDHPVEDYVRERFMSGVMIWTGGLQGYCPYSLENSWDDSTPIGGNYRNMGYIYSGRNAPIPTIQLAGYRDGVNDFTDLEMLARRVTACRGRKLDATATRALAEAETLAHAAPAKFRVSCRDASAKLTVTDFDEFHAELQRLIVALDAAAGPCGCRKLHPP